MQALACKSAAPFAETLSPRDVFQFVKELKSFFPSIAPSPKLFAQFSVWFYKQNQHLFFEITSW